MYFGMYGLVICGFEVFICAFKFNATQQAFKSLFFSTIMFFALKDAYAIDYFECFLLL